METIKSLKNFVESSIKIKDELKKKQKIQIQLMVDEGKNIII